jgi:acetylornithine deacetylase
MSQTVEILHDLIGFATVSRDPNRALIDYVADRLDDAGISVTVIPDDSGKKANLFASTGPQEPDNGGVMLSGHTDVVPIDGQDWTRPAFTCTEEDGRLYGRGTADMKGFCAAAITSFVAASRLPMRSPLHLALSHDEEIGCIGVRSMIEMMAKAPFRPAMCIVGEPTHMGLGTGHKGKTAIRAHCHGRAGHSALAPLAVNALHLACDLAGEIRATQDELRQNGAQDDDYNIPYTTLHVGRIDGGVQLNIVPHEAVIDFEIRNLAEDNPQDIIQTIERRIAPIIARAQQIAPEAAINFTITNTYPGLNTAADEDVVTLLKSLTGANTTIKMAFGTEGGLFSRDLGIPTVICGPGSMDQGHKPDEFVTRQQLALCDDMLAKLNQRLVAGL